MTSSEEPISIREEIYHSFEKEYEKPIVMNMAFDPDELRRKIERGFFPIKDYSCGVADSKEQFGTGAQRDSQEEKLRFDLIPPAALIRMAELYRKGAEHYGENNWQKGIPYKRVMASVFRHMYAYWDGDRSEDHQAAVAWGMFTLMHYDREIERGNLPKELKDI